MPINNTLKQLINKVNTLETNVYVLQSELLQLKQKDIEKDQKILNLELEIDTLKQQKA